MVDVGRDDGAAGGNLIAHELRRDEPGDAVRKALEERRLIRGDPGRRLLTGAAMLMLEGSARGLRGETGFERFQALILAQGDELHLGGDDALPGVPQLSDGMALGDRESVV